MNLGSRAALLALVTTLISPLMSEPARAWKGEAAGYVVSIAEIREKGEMGDRVTIEATIVRVKKNRLYDVRDATGEMVVLIPEHVRRESGTPKRNQIVRLSGAFDREKLGKSIEGIRVQSLEILGNDTSAAGPAADPVESADPGPARIERSAGSSASEGASTATVVQPDFGDEWVRRLREARQASDAAARESEEASAEYARALHRAGTPDAVDPAIRDREARARVHNAQARAEVARLVAEARAEGLSEDILRLYEQATLGR